MINRYTETAGGEKMKNRGFVSNYGLIVVIENLLLKFSITTYISLMNSKKTKSRTNDRKYKDLFISSRHSISAVFLLFLTLISSGCSKSEMSLRIAEQFGIAYAPLAVMKEFGYLEEELPGVTVRWIQTGGPTAIREGFVSGDIDVGFMGAAPALIGIDKGMGWRIATGISSNESALVTDKPEIHRLTDFTAKDRIAVLSPGCTQHVLLSLLSEKETGDSTAYDRQIVAMTHPDAMNAILADTEVSAHFATPPYLGTELAAGMHIIATGEEILGEPFTFIVGVAGNQFHDERPEQYAAFLRALDHSIQYINEDMDRAAELLAPEYGISKKELLEQMQYHGSIYTTRVTGIETLSEAMARTGFIEKARPFKEITFENVSP